MQLFFVLQKYNFFQKYQKKNTTFSKNLHGNFTTFPFLCLFLQPGGVGSVVVGGTRREGGEVADKWARAAAVGGMVAGSGGCGCGAYDVLVYGFIPAFDLQCTCFRLVMYLLGTS